MIRALAIVVLAVSAPFAFGQVVGPRDGGMVVPTSQLVRPAGESIEFPARPVDVALSPDGAWLYAKDNKGVVVIDAATWVIKQEIACGGASMAGIAVSPDGSRVLSTTAADEVVELLRGAEGLLKVERRLKLPGPGGKGKSYPCGVTISKDGTKAYVCLSINNSLAEVDLPSARVLREIAVGVAPYAVVLSPDGETAYVSNWGGRRAKEGELTAPSAGTPAVVDARGIATSGGVGILGLNTGSTAFVETGRSACGVVLAGDGSRLFVANANDDTVTEIDTKAGTVVRQISVRPDKELPFGSMPNGLALTPDGARLLVSLAGNNAVAVIDVREGGAKVAGFVPTAWYPGGVVAGKDAVFVANIKGVGSRSPRGNREGFNSHGHRGTLQKFALPGAAELSAMTAQVLADSQVPQVLRAIDRAEKSKDAKPVPVPARPGEPSVIEHCVYIIKENRTYDQIFGAIGRGNSEPKLCIYGREITPNHHALADQFVLLDNYYCNGVLSADGHSWATEGNVTPYLERAFGGFTRSYTFGDDPLTYSSSGFIWDHVLAAGLTFRNYGEFNYSHEKPDVGYDVFYKDWQEKAGKIRIEHSIGVENVKRYSHPEYPGWNMDIPDVYRAEVFLKELAEFEAKGTFPNLVIIYLPNDHTSGTGEGNPMPRSLVADNDLALGRIVEGLTKSKFWPKMAIFANEDDPQDGFDHVDGHRSICLVVSPYTRRGGAVVSEFYNQSSVIHTIERILGITPMNQLYALSPVMSTCFVETPDVTPFAALPNTVPLAEMNPKKSSLGPKAREFAEISAGLALSKPDACDEDTLNRILWHAAKGVDAPYPADLAGAHGTGLMALGLKFAERGGLEEDEEEDDDDD